MVQWLDHSLFLSLDPLRSRVRFADRIPERDSNSVLMCEKSKSLRSAESRGFPPGTPVSSHRESRQGGLGDTGPQ